MPLELELLLGLEMPLELPDPELEEPYEPEDPELPESDDDEPWLDLTSIFSACAWPSTIWYDARTSLPGWICFADEDFPSTVIAVESLSWRFMSRSPARTFRESEEAWKTLPLMLRA